MDKSQWQERIQLIEKALVQELKRKPALEPKLQEAME